MLDDDRQNWAAKEVEKELSNSSGIKSNWYFVSADSYVREERVFCANTHVCNTGDAAESVAILVTEADTGS